jgi:hypothetical protein
MSALTDAAGPRAGRYLLKLPVRIFQSLKVKLMQCNIF